MILKLMIAALVLALTLCPAEAKKQKPAKSPKPPATILDVLSNKTLHIPKCTTAPQVVQVSLEDAYEKIWTAYQTTKVDRQKKGKNIFDEYFGHKDELAAKRLGLSLREYVLKIDHRLIVPAAQMILAMDADGLRTGVTTAYRDPWRQELATGFKAGKYQSYHGSRPDLKGKSAALDLASYSDDGDRRAQLERNQLVYAWIERHGRKFNICRPYVRDAPHVGLCDGQEYLSKRGGGTHAKVATGKRKKSVHRVAHLQPSLGSQHPSQ